MRALVLRFDAPMMALGSVMIDQHGFIDRFPATSMLTGMVANALGWDHRDSSRLQALQERIRFAARWDVVPDRMVDYHTVDLGQPKMRGYTDPARRGDPVGGWTTRGEPDHRGGRTSAKFGIHPRYRHYWTDGLLTLVLTLISGASPSLDQLLTALKRPARPLFFGRKVCLPARPLLDPDTPLIEGENLLAMLRRVPNWDRCGKEQPYDPTLIACWPDDIEDTESRQLRHLHDMRDWKNQLHVSGRTRAEGLIGEGAS